MTFNINDFITVNAEVILTFPDGRKMSKKSSSYMLKTLSDGDMFWFALNELQARCKK